MVLQGRNTNIVSELEVVEIISISINRKMVEMKTTKKIILMTRYQIDLIGGTRSIIKENIIMIHNKHMMMKILNIIITNKIEKNIWFIKPEIVQILSLVQEVEEAEAVVVKVEVVEEGGEEVTEEINAMTVIEKMKMINTKVNNTKMMHQENINRKRKNKEKLES